VRPEAAPLDRRGRATGRLHAASSKRERTTELQSRVMLTCCPSTPARPRPIGRIGQQSTEGSAGNRDGSVGRVNGVHDTTPSWESRSNQQKKQISRACDAEALTAEGIEKRRRCAAALRLRVALTVRAFVRVFVSAIVRARGSELIAGPTRQLAGGAAAVEDVAAGAGGGSMIACTRRTRVILHHAQMALR